MCTVHEGEVYLISQACVFKYNPVAYVTFILTYEIPCGKFGLCYFRSV